MNRSETITEIAKALAAAQGKFPPVPKTRTNPLFKHKYATLDDVINTVRGPLAAHGLSFVQPLSNGADGAVVLETVIIHQSGEWLSTIAHVPALSGNKATNELQTFGGALTYMRRYMLTSMLGISSEEDGDGNGEKSKPKRARSKPTGPPPPKGDSPPPPHWVDDSKQRAGFWAWAKKLALSSEDVHQALDVESLRDFTGTMGVAKTCIKAWVDAKTEAA